MLRFFVAVALLGVCCLEGVAKEGSALYPPSLVASLHEKAETLPWVGAVRERIVAKAAPWREMSDDALWDMVFGHTITRSWMVWSNGHCPTCKASVPMYTWKMDAMGHPWKTQCPHCEAWFPKNDFEAYYRSGLDGGGVFDGALANRDLLFNAEHPYPTDPLYQFGVDDGEGYVDGENRWRFIGCYLIYGQWKQGIVEGVRTLSAAYLMTGDVVYAHKAGVLLDRVADLYPNFDFGSQAILYERKADRGYVSTWHDACEETRELVMAYDIVFEAIAADAELVKFLSAKAAQCGLENGKATFADIQRNIEDRILRDALANRPKITTNYPRTEIAVAIIHKVLGGAEDEAAFTKVVDDMLVRATAVDGVTGEKGLAGYSSFTIQALAMFLGEFSKADPEFLKDLIARHPRLKETFRFFIDTYCLNAYYPLIGDTGSYANQVPEYKGMLFLRPAAGQGNFPYWTLLAPSSFTLLWRFYEETGDPAYVQTAYQNNGKSMDGMPHDFFSEDTEAIAAGMAKVIEEKGPEPVLGSVHKEEWHLGILRSGKGEHRRALWLDYDSGGGHGHQDGMNLGLFAYGLDLLPEMGYPPVQFGGWGSPRARWYKKSAAHNTVVVDGKDSGKGAGKTTLWADGTWFRGIRAAGKKMNDGKRFERSAFMVDLSGEDFYVIDLFRVAGGREHTQFFQSHFGEMTMEGVALAPAEDYGHGTQMRALQRDPAAKPGWSATWTVNDRRDYRGDMTPLHMRYTALTQDASAGRAEAWITTGMYNTSEELWIPRVLVQRRLAASDEELESTFVGVLEPYRETPLFSSIENLAVPEGWVGISLERPNGERHLFLSRDGEREGNPLLRLEAPLAMETNGETILIRMNAQGEAESAALCGGGYLRVGGREIMLEGGEDFTENRF
jgi:oligo-alginate lyase